RDKSIEAAIVAQNADLFYFTGTVQGEYLYIPNQGEVILFVSKDNKRAKSEAPLKRVIEFRRTANLSEIIKKEKSDLAKELGLELDVLPYRTATKLQEIFKADKISNITTLIRQVRMIKSESEVQLIKSAAEKLAVVPQLTEENLTMDMSELELSSIIEQELRERGHAGFIRMRGLNNEIPIGICTAGEQATSEVNIDSICAGAGLHPSAGTGASFNKIKEGEPIILDYVATHNGYHADQTRMAVIGEVSDYIQELYDKMLYLQNELSNYLTPEYSCEDIYNQGMKLAEKLGVTDYYLGSGDNKEEFVGHGVGVELNEFPFLAPGLNFKLKAGMTIALEPKLVIPKLGVIGIENTYLVTENQPEKLTTASEKLIKV
ncbi:MAG: Xaa-Pro peptidase family protein, partial [Halanaerobacter sp.]